MRFATPVALFAALAVATDSTTTVKVTSTTKQVVTVTSCHSTYTDCPLHTSSPVANTTTVHPTGVVPTTTAPTVLPTGAAARLQSGAMAVAAAAVLALAL